MSHTLLRRLANGPMLCDGAMATQLMARGLRIGESPEAWNLDRPHDVEAVHRSYVEAGCSLVTTNTFGANTWALARHGLQNRAAEINELGVRLARRAVGGSAFLLGNMGPFGGYLKPRGQLSEKEVYEIFRLQASALKRGGADAILIETMSDPAEMRIAIEACKLVADWPVLATFAFDHPGSGTFHTMTGATVEAALRAARDAGADAVGANCGTDMTMDDYVRLGSELVAASGGVPVIIQPNAGQPQQVGEEMRYPATPEDMAGIVPPLLEAGVHIIGGCCGTTPAHLRAMKQAMQIPTSEEH